MRKKKESPHVKVRTKYYRATYLNSDGLRESEVFISESLLSAQEYAAGENARGRVLEDVQEYDKLIDALL